MKRIYLGPQVDIINLLCVSHINENGSQAFLFYQRAFFPLSQLSKGLSINAIYLENGGGGIFE